MWGVGMRALDIGGAWEELTVEGEGRGAVHAGFCASGATARTQKGLWPPLTCALMVSWRDGATVGLCAWRGVDGDRRPEKERERGKVVTWARHLGWHALEQHAGFALDGEGRGT